jgi:hypothetical protein
MQLLDRMTDLRQIADEIELQIHLAGMEARDKWASLKPRLVELERQFEATGKRVGKAIDHEVEVLAQALRQLRDDMND